jgi:hypothetical protein
MLLSDEEKIEKEFFSNQESRRSGKYQDLLIKGDKSLSS